MSSSTPWCSSRACVQVDLGTSEMHHAYEFWERMPSSNNGSRGGGRDGSRGQKGHGQARAACGPSSAWQV